MGRWFGGIKAAASLPATFPVYPEVASPWADRTPLEAVTIAGLFDAEALVLTRSQVIGNPVVARGRDLIAVTIGRLPIFAVQAAGRLPTQPSWLQQPEAGRPRSTTVTWTVDDLLFYGVAFWEIVSRDFTNRPNRFRWLPRQQCDVRPSTGELLSCAGRAITDYIRFDGPHEGLITRARQSIIDARHAMRSYARAADNPVPSIDLHQTGGAPLDDVEQRQLIDSWAAARRGQNGGVAYTNQVVDARVLGVPVENLLIDTLKRVDLDLTRHMNLPAWATDAPVEGQNLTYQNVQGAARQLIDYTLAGYITAIADRLSLDDVLPHLTWAEIDTDSLTLPDFAARMAGYKAAQDANVYTAEECRAMETTAPLETPSA